MTADDLLIYQTITHTDERGDCRNCDATWDRCLTPNDYWLPCCHRCDHP